MPIVHVPLVLRDLTDHQDCVEVDGTTVAEVLAKLEANYPGFASALFESPATLRRHVSLYVRPRGADVGLPLEELDGLSTDLAARDTLSIMVAIHGG